MISLMDKILKKENLDLKLTPYRYGDGQLGLACADAFVRGAYVLLAPPVAGTITSRSNAVLTF